MPDDSHELLSLEICRGSDGAGNRGSDGARNRGSGGAGNRGSDGAEGPVSGSTSDRGAENCAPACRFALEPDPRLLQGLARVVRDCGWEGFVRSRFPGVVPSHARFRVAVAGCANGCSRPPIADMGFVRAVRPAIATPDQCTGCSLCVEACPEGFVSLADDSPAPVMDRNGCLLCGRCIRACEFGVLAPGDSGWRVLAGGKLGRMPRLASDLGGPHSPDQALAMFRNALSLMMRESRPGERLGALMDRLGEDQVLAELRGGLS